MSAMHPIRSLRSLLIAVATLVALGTVAAPATADHTFGRQQQTTCSYGKCNHTADARMAYPRFGKPTCRAHRAFERGFALGHREGNSRGYLDGFYDYGFDDQTRRHLRRRSVDFIEGFLLAYEVAYREGYDRGRSIRQRAFSSCTRRRWWW